MSAGAVSTIDATMLPARTTASVLAAPRTTAVAQDLAEPVRDIIEQVRNGGESALRELAGRHDGLPSGLPLLLDGAALRESVETLSGDRRALLERVATRIRNFATAQRDAVRPLVMHGDGARIGHTVEPIEVAGCYAPGGRHPLPSSVLMTAVTARAAGVERVIVASPSRDPLMVAAAGIAGADAYLNVGGAHAIAALAHGVVAPRCGVIVGPGNRWVTEAKRQLVGTVGIDMLAGPSELLVIADETADAATVADDLLAQAEHDVDAAAWLVTTDAPLADRVRAAVAERLATLAEASRTVASEALRNGGIIVCATLDEAITVADAIAPEHLEIMTRDAARIADRIRNAGGVFIGQRSAEVLGDYGIGPNHTLPTGGTARFSAGLSVMHFLRLRTFVEVIDGTESDSMIADAAALARLEGLEAHACAAEVRRR